MSQVAADLVEGQVEEVRLLGDIDIDDGDGVQTEPSRRDEPLVAADDDWSSWRARTGCTKPNSRRLRSGLELGVADLAGVGRVGAQVVDWDLDDLEIAAGTAGMLPSGSRRANKKDACPLGSKRPHSGGFSTRILPVRPAPVVTLAGLSPNQRITWLISAGMYPGDRVNFARDGERHDRFGSESRVAVILRVGRQPASKPMRPPSFCGLSWRRCAWQASSLPRARWPISMLTRSMSCHDRAKSVGRATFFQSTSRATFGRPSIPSDSDA